MWLMMPTGGFVSVVCKAEDAARGTVTIRGRQRGDLAELEAFVSPLGPIEAGGGTDYGFRVVVPRAAFEAGVQAMARAVDYPSYKDHVAVTKGGGRARVYHMVWTILRKLQRP